MKTSSITTFQTGTVDLLAFDKMVEKAAFAPRRFGLAPKTSDLFPTEAVHTFLNYQNGFAINENIMAVDHSKVCGRIFI